jgi:glycerol-3-phosphate acyltransferase PlsY
MMSVIDSIWSVGFMALAYLMGSVPFGLVLSRLAGYGDIRQIGSGNIGATNVLRTGNKALAAATVILDALKGTAAVILVYLAASYVFRDVNVECVVTQTCLPDYEYISHLAGLAAFFALLGHVFPVWLGFKGGKGVATFLGCLLALHPLSALIFAGSWIMTAVTTRLSSASALAATLIAGLSAFWMDVPVQQGLIILAMIVLIWYKHQENIKRLLAGTEPKIGKKADQKH